MNEHTSPTATADYVVIGTGSAGSVVAEGLSSDARNEVLALEAGGEDTDRRIRIPAAFSQLFRSEFNGTI